MLIYWAIFVVLAAGSLFALEGLPGSRRPTFILLAAIPIALMIGLRSRIGPDFGSYVLIFDGTKYLPLSLDISHQDPAFYILNWLAHQAGATFWQFNLFCATIFTGGLVAFSLRQPNPWIAILVAFPYLVIVVAMSGVRQSIAIGLLFFALNAYEENRLWTCTFIVLFASLFHASAILLGPICVLSHGSKRLLSVVLVILFSIIGFRVLNDSFGTYAGRYSQASIQSTGVWFRLVMNAIPAIIFLNWRWQFDIDEHQRLLWRNISLLSLVAIPLALILPSTTAIDRFILYLFPLQFFVFSRAPQVFAKSVGDRVQITLRIIAYAGAAQLTFLTLGTFARFYVPYHSVIEDQRGLADYKRFLVH